MSTEQTTDHTIEKITETDFMRREINRGLMVAWINHDLFKRANNDVDKSIVFYDEALVFHTAVRVPHPKQVMDKIAADEKLRRGLWDEGVRFWSVGVV